MTLTQWTALCASPLVVLGAVLVRSAMERPKPTRPLAAARDLEDERRKRRAREQASEQLKSNRP